MKIIVIGNGIAGNAACSSIRASSKSRGIDVTLISQEPYPLYSPCIFTNFISQEIKKKDVFLKRLNDYSIEGINALLGRVVKRIEPHSMKVFLEEEELAYDRLIVATGSRPVIPAIEGVQKRGVRALKSFRDARYLLKSQGRCAIIIGSGPIGVELAIALRKRNWDVCIIEILDWILPTIFDEKPSFLVRKILEQQNIEVLTGRKVVAIEGKRNVNGILTDRGERKKADLVVLATGMRPCTELAREAGIEIGTLGGIRTDERMETSLKDIYACGDCVEGKDPLMLKPKLTLLWPNAERQGRVAGFNSIGENHSIHWMSDAINLNIFGTFAGAIGLPRNALGHRNSEVLEEETGQNYHSLVISHGKVMGGQFIGNYEGIGALFHLIGADYEAICRHIKNEREATLFPWYYATRNLTFN